jgi:MerR family mercuric resistance operon transcriptional regulator
MDDASMTIAGVADAAQVGVETVRYYERRGLIAQPTRTVGAYRRYDDSHVARIRFIKRAQELGFTLEEVEDLLKLQDGTDRRTIRTIAGKRLEQIRHRIADLKRIEKALAHVLRECEGQSGRPHCPIIEAMNRAFPSARRAARPKASAASSTQP